MSAWIDVVGIGEDGLAGLGARARAAIAAAEVIVGGEHHLALVPADGRERIAWSGPFAALAARLAACRPRRVCVLASGDPLCYGAGTRLLRHFPRQDLCIHPAPSAFSLACARLGWSLPDCDTLTLHGRPLATLHPYVQPGVRLLALCRDASTPAAAAALLAARGYGPSRLHVLERLGGPRERIVTRRAGEGLPGDLDDLCTLAIECLPGPTARHLPRTPGLPEEAFEHHGRIAPPVVRAAALAALGPSPGALLWDVGAGCGALAIEWLRAARGARAIAIERDPACLAVIERNAEALGTPGIERVGGEAPAALGNLPDPDAVHVAAGAGDPALLAACWERLRPGGRLVASAAGGAGERALTDLAGRVGGTLTRIAVGPPGAPRPAAALLLLAAAKPWGGGDGDA